MAKAIKIGTVHAKDDATGEFRPLDVSVSSDETGHFAVQVGGARMEHADAGWLARNIMAAAAKAGTLNLVNGVTA